MPRTYAGRIEVGEPTVEEPALWSRASTREWVALLLGRLLEGPAQDREHREIPLTARRFLGPDQGCETQGSDTVVTDLALDHVREQLLVAVAVTDRTKDVDRPA